MTAGAVIAIRRRRALAYLRERGAVTPETALPRRDIPYADRWYFRTLIRHGAVQLDGDRCYLDEAGVRRYRTAMRRRGAIVLVVALAVAGLLYLLS